MMSLPRLSIVPLLVLCLASGAWADTFRDEFNSRDYDNNDGTHNWSTDWNESGDGGGSTGGDIQVDNDVSNYQLRIQDDDNAIEREADLSAYDNAILSFVYRREDLENSNEYAAIDVSNNGGSSWTELDRFPGNADDNSYSYVSYDISAYIAADTRIRFRTPNGGMNNGDQVWFDNVQIEATMAAPVGPVGQWNLDENEWTGIAGEVLDSSGNDLHASIVGNATPVPAYVCNGAFLDGSSYVEVADNALLDITAELTVTAWINADTVPSGGGNLKSILSKDENYEFHLEDGEIYWWWSTSSGQTRTFTTSGANITTGNWYHVAIVYSRSRGEQRVYVNGVSMAAQPGSTTNSSESLQTNNDPLQIGADQGYADRQFEGRIDEVRVYNTAMTHAEVVDVMNDTHDCPEPPLTCFNDDFNRSTLGSDWATSTSSGNFGLPRIVNNRLRLTDNSTNASTAATLMRLFPGANNKVILEFDYNAYDGSGADGIAVTFSDASVTPVPGGYGGSLGYAQRCGTNGFAGGWLGVGLDEYGNFPNPTECRSGGTGFIQDNVSVRGSGSGTTGYPYVGGTGGLSPGVDQSGSTPGPGHRYRITVDHSNSTEALVTVERDTTGTGNNYVELVSEFDILTDDPAQAPVPQNWLISFTGSSGGSTNIHELENLQVCAFYMDAFTTVDHFRFYHDGSGLTCSPESVTVRACMNADCTTEYTGTITAVLSPGGWVDGDTQVFNSGDTLQLWHTTAETATLGVVSSTPERTPFSQDRCFVGGVEQADCSMLFADSGFAFDVPDHTADTIQTVDLRAVRRDDTTQQCVPGFADVTRSVSLWSTYLNPGTGSFGVAVDGTDVPGASPGSTRDLAFDANGVARIEVRYPDAGSMRLHARYEGSAATDDAGLVMTGEDDFVARPAEFELSIPGNPAATDASGAAFMRAGESFEISVAARNASGNITPNYGREDTPETVRITHALVEPVGGNDGNFGSAAGFGAFGQDCDGNAAAAGTACGLWSWDEVGILSLTPGVGDSDYLGAGDVTDTVVPYVGRFVPARLRVSANTPEFGHACAVGGFTYLGQEFGFDTDPALSVSGLNLSGGVTRNYDGAFWRLPGTFAGRNYANTAAGTAASVTLSTDGGAAVVGGDAVPPYDGTRSFTIAGDGITYDKPDTPEAPFDARVDLQLPAADLTDTDGACYDPDANGSCDAFTLADIEGTELRWGRLVLQNAHGSELLDLPMTLRAEVYNGSGFLLHAADQCTALVPATHLRLSNPDTAGGAEQPGTTAMTIGGGNTSATLAFSPLSAGLGGLEFSAPGAGNTGYVDVRVALGSDFPWLAFDWDGDGIADNDPQARASFGLFPGSPRQIYIREVY